MLRPSARWVRALAFAAVAGCGSGGGSPGQSATCKAGLPSSDTCATAAPSYATDIAPVVQAHCLDCHFAGNTNSTVVLETQSEIDHQAQLVETEVYRCEMPPSDGVALSSDERTLLLQWLVCGAPNN